jgi:hypothetical protein
MNFQLIEGGFEAKDALQILTELIDVKIRYHEGKINLLTQEEDIKMRETRIQKLQSSKNEIRMHLEKSQGLVNLSSEIHIQPTK